MKPLVFLKVPNSSSGKTFYYHPLCEASKEFLKANAVLYADQVTMYHLESLGHSFTILTPDELYAAKQ